MVAVGCFFFKQKTAYEMRISDWSSDVCSSDLIVPELLIGHGSGGVRGTAVPLLVEHDDGAGFRKGVHPVQHRVGGHERARDEQQRNPEIGRASCRERVCQYVYI